MAKRNDDKDDDDKKDGSKDAVEAVCVKKCYRNGVLYNVGDRAKFVGDVPEHFRKA